MKKTRRRGGQPGNLNALKHGYYSKYFVDGEKVDLDVLLSEGLDDEIAMLRVMTRRVMGLAEDNKNIGEMADILGVLGLAATRLAGLLRTQKLIAGESSSVTSAISQALAEVVEELKLE